MIAKIIKGKGRLGAFRLIRYLYLPKRETAFSAGLSDHYRAGERLLATDSDLLLQMLPGESVVGAAERMSEEIFAWNDRCRAGKEAAKAPFIHGCISWHVDDRIDPELAIQIVKEVVAKVMPGERPCLYVCHGDRAHLHVHFCVSTVASTGTIWNPRFDFRLWEAEMEAMEIRHGFTRVLKRKSEAKKSPDRAPEEIGPGQNEFQYMRRTGKSSDRRALKLILKTAAQDKPTMAEFVRRIEQQNVTVRRYLADDGKTVGIAYEYGGFSFPGHSLGKIFSWPGLQEKFGITEDDPSQFLAECPEGNRAGSLLSEDPVDRPMGNFESEDAIESQPRHKGMALTGKDIARVTRHLNFSTFLVESATPADEYEPSDH